MNEPRRRIEMTLKLSADSWDEASSALEHIATEIHRGIYRQSCISGGPYSGFILDVSEDETITHESWAAEIAAWSERTRSAL